MRSEPLIAFLAEPTEPPDVEIRINFGVFAGREATPAELDDLGRAAMEQVDHVTLVSEHRHELGGGSETSLHQVRMGVPRGALPADAREAQGTRDRLVALAESWAQSCIDARHADVIELFPGDAS
ncbi:MAG TPA: hypothetical protein VHS03_13505 [Gaiellaceae bacterium]|nr:hypothetical protein [Gaiellaceae bacterium]